MKLLLDTHVLLWWLLNDPRLSATARKLLLDRSNLLFLSSVSAFEIATKFASGKLKLPSDPQTFVSEVMTEGRVDDLPLTLAQAMRVLQLPLLHRDPFDRLLVCAAIEENLTLLTADPAIRQYSVPTVW